MALIRGEEYLASLRDGRQVWLAGERVDVTSHPALAGCARTLAEHYDLQHDPEYRDLLTMESPSSGERVSLAYIEPHSMDDLIRRRRMTEFFARRNGGVLGRTPEFMATILLGLHDVRHILAEEESEFATNVSRYFEFCRERNLCLTHSFSDPPKNKNVPAEEFEMFRVTERRKDGIVLRGARAVATLAPYANEYLGVTSPRPGLGPENVVYFAVPMNSPGVRIFCREPFAGSNAQDHPLSAFYDEIDAWVILEDVFVPRERVFLLRRVDVAARLFGSILGWSSYHTLVREIVKTECILGVCVAVADYLGNTKLPETQQALYQIIAYVEALRAFLDSAESRSVRSFSGLVAPNPKQILLGRLHCMQHHARILDRAREVCGAGLLMAPRQGDLANPEIRKDVERYLVGPDKQALERYQMLKLAWDYLGDSFATRQPLFEMYAGASFPVNKARLLAEYDTSSFVALAKQLAGIKP
jgi:aromatic ring hydroxylase